MPVAHKTRYKQTPLFPRGVTVGDQAVTAEGFMINDTDNAPSAGYVQIPYMLFAILDALMQHIAGQAIAMMYEPHQQIIIDATAAYERDMFVYMPSPPCI